MDTLDRGKWVYNTPDPTEGLSLDSGGWGDALKRIGYNLALELPFCDEHLSVRLVVGYADGRGYIVIADSELSCFTFGAATSSDMLQVAALVCQIGSMAGLGDVQASIREAARL